jgi:hypothetical protein
VPKFSTPATSQGAATAATVLTGMASGARLISSLEGGEFIQRACLHH